MGTARIMNVCGEHERSVAQSGMRKLLPENVKLIPGPGCAPCVCPERDIYQAIQLALHHDVILTTSDAMLRVPVSGPRSEPRSLAEARTAGGDIRIVDTPAEARRLAEQNPHRSVVLFAAGFETTSVPVAAMLVEGAPDNLYVMLATRRTKPAVAMVLNADPPGFDALIAPGHVSSITGPEEWSFVPEQHQIPAAVAGFTASSLLAAIYSVLRQRQAQAPYVDNYFQALAHPGGNKTAQQNLDSAFTVDSAHWRDIGPVAESGYRINTTYAPHDARVNFPGYDDQRLREFDPEPHQRRAEMPPGCDCSRVVMGKVYPNQCKLYGKACQPDHPVGPCMVSDEGTCQIWWSSGVGTLDNVS